MYLYIANSSPATRAKNVSVVLKLHGYIDSKSRLAISNLAFATFASTVPSSKDVISSAPIASKAREQIFNSVSPVAIVFPFLNQKGGAAAPP